MGGSNAKLINSKRLDGTTAIVTGSNAGIGKVTAKELYKLGARVIMACRDVKRAEDAAASIRTELSEQGDVGELVVKQLNLGSFESVKKCAQDLNQSESNINLLINNAGVMFTKGKTDDGYEINFGVNHLGHFLLTNLLLPKIIDSSPSKIINVSSEAHKSGRLIWDDLHFEKRSYSALGAYCQSKLANVYFTVELANRLKDTGVVAYSLHPGLVKTELGRYMDDTYFSGARRMMGLIASMFAKTPEEGALTTLYCALKDYEDDSGKYFSDCKLYRTFDGEKDLQEAKMLWERSTEMTKKYLEENKY